MKQLYKPDNTTRYTNRERLMIIFHVTYFDVPRRRVNEWFGVARSTFYRWLERIDGRAKRTREAWNRTTAAIAALVWEVAQRERALGPRSYRQSATLAGPLRRPIDSAQHPEPTEASVAFLQTGRRGAAA